LSGTREKRAIQTIKDSRTAQIRRASIANAGELNMAKSGFAAGQLKSLVERVERLEEEKAALAADIREIYAEAKGGGFDTKIMRHVIRIRRLDKADRQEQEAILGLYLSALGMRN
jgi:uncharacterized protein (UPF0335 family)